MEKEKTLESFITRDWENCRNIWILTYEKWRDAYQTKHFDTFIRLLHGLRRDGETLLPQQLLDFLKEFEDMIIFYKVETFSFDFKLSDFIEEFPALFSRELRKQLATPPEPIDLYDYKKRLGEFRSFLAKQAHYTGNEKNLGTLLIDSGLIKKEDLEKALILQKRRLGEVLIDEKMVTPEDLEEILIKHRTQESRRQEAMRWRAKRNRIFSSILTVHVIASMAALLLFLFYLFTGFVMNHGDWFDLEGSEIQRLKGHVSVEHFQNNDLKAVEKEIREKYGIKGYLEAAQEFDQNVQMNFSSISDTVETWMDKETGEANIVIEKHNLLATICNIHILENTKKRGGKFFIDATVLTFLLILVTGVVLGLMNRGHRFKKAMWAAGIGSLFFIVFYWWLIH